MAPPRKAAKPPLHARNGLAESGQDGHRPAGLLAIASIQLAAHSLKKAVSITASAFSTAQGTTPGLAHSLNPQSIPARRRRDRRYHFARLTDSRTAKIVSIRICYVSAGPSEETLDEKPANECSPDGSDTTSSPRNHLEIVSNQS